MSKLLSTTFRSLKPHSQNPKSPATNLPISSPSPSKSNPNWSVYLLLSTNPPIKTYVGVTNNFSRRLKQHNGELNGGAKATQAGRPWICACIVQGFESKSEACKFEFKWKSVSSKMTRKKNSKKDDGGLHLLQHRNAALQKVKGPNGWTKKGGSEWAVKKRSQVRMGGRSSSRLAINRFCCVTNNFRIASRTATRFRWSVKIH